MRIHRMSGIVAAGLLLGALRESSAQPAMAGTTFSARTSSAIDALFAPYAHSGSPGCGVGVYQHGAVTFARGYGFANLTNDVPITPATRFTVGSVSKQFTAASIALLVRAGKLSLDDDVRKYLPELPAYDVPVRIRHLVHHTSGLRDFWELASVSGMRLDDGYTSADMLALAARQRQLNFTPGSAYRYSNTGYLAMGLVVQRVTGQSLRRFADSAIFLPLRMHETLFLDDHNEIVSGRAMAYEPTAGGFRVNVWNNDLVGQGGVVTSLADLQRWDENFYTASVGGQAFLDLLDDTEPLIGGASNSYAFGNTMSTYRGQRLVEHTGATGGYRAALFRFPEQHTTVALLCNVSTANTAALAMRVADVVLSDALTPVAPASAAAAPTVASSTAAVPPSTRSSGGTRSAERAAILGRFVSAELNDAVFEIRAPQADGPMTLVRPRLAPLVLAESATGWTYRAGPDIVLRFDVPTRGRAMGFTLDGGRISGIRFVRLP